MTAQQPIAAVAGASGRAGRCIVAELKKRGYRVRALVRSATAQSAGEQECVAADLQSTASLEQALEGAGFLISAIGSKKPFSKTENDLVDNRANCNLAQAAKNKGLKLFVVVSSIGAGNSRSAISWLYRLAMGPVLKAKTASEEYIRSCGVPYTIIRPGGYTVKEVPDEIAYGEGGFITGLITREQVAHACVDALEKPAMHNRTFEVVNAAKVKEGMQGHIIAV